MVVALSNLLIPLEGIWAPRRAATCPKPLPNQDRSPPDSRSACALLPPPTSPSPSHSQTHRLRKPGHRAGEKPAGRGPGPVLTSADGEVPRVSFLLPRSEMGPHPIWWHPLLEELLTPWVASTASKLHPLVLRHEEELADLLAQSCPPRGYCS